MGYGGVGVQRLGWLVGGLGAKQLGVGGGGKGRGGGGAGKNKAEAGGRPKNEEASLCARPARPGVGR